MTSVVVVGGGLVGTATAYYAAREGMQVTLLEQRHTGYGASGRNPGFVWLHCRNPGWALEISLAGRALYDELLRELPVPFEFRADGGIIYIGGASYAGEIRINGVVQASLPYTLSPTVTTTTTTTTTRPP